MIIRELQLSGFRSYETAQVTLQPGPNVLLGFNGVGKTNIIEAIGYLSTLSSHRVSNDGPLIQVGKQQALIRAYAQKRQQQVQLDVEINASRANRGRINAGAPVAASEVLGIMRTVVFSPEDLDLIKGSPDGRRRFFDSLAVQLRPWLGKIRLDYEKVLKQRNALLKSARQQGLQAEHESTLDVWDEHLAQAGARLLRARLDMVHALAPCVGTAYQQISRSVRTAIIRYISSWDDADPALHDSEGNTSSSTAEQQLAADAAGLGVWVTASVEELKEQLVKQLRSRRREESDRGMTLVGPHRDDIDFRLDDVPVKGYASHGETWSYALALRLGSAEVMRDDDPDPAAEPILILDDVFAELDARRRSRLAELTAGSEQVIITAAVDDDVPSALLENGYRITSVNQRSHISPLSTPVENSTSLDDEQPQQAPAAASPAQESSPGENHTIGDTGDEL